MRRGIPDTRLRREPANIRALLKIALWEYNRVLELSNGIISFYFAYDELVEYRGFNLGIFKRIRLNLYIYIYRRG